MSLMKTVRLMLYCVCVTVFVCNYLCFVYNLTEYVTKVYIEFIYITYVYLIVFCKHKNALGFMTQLLFQYSIPLRIVQFCVVCVVCKHVSNNELSEMFFSLDIVSLNTTYMCVL